MRDTSTPGKPKAPPGEITLSPFYYSAINEVTKPSSLVFVSHYFADRWMRDLGPLATAIVVCLRSHCYHNAKTGEKRDQVQISVPLIAAEIGVAAKTVRREIDANRTLPKFVQRREEWAPGRTPQSLRRDSYTYRVAMDDPLHPLDEERLTEIVREKARLAEKGQTEETGQTAEDAKARARRRAGQSGPKPPGQKPSGQNDQTTSGLDILTTGLDNLAPPLDILTRGSGQNVQTLKDSSSFPENPLNSSLALPPDASSGFSASLFEEGEGTEKQAAVPPGTPPAWADLTDEARRPFVARAQAELHKYAVQAGAARWARIGPRQEAVRARNIYETEQKGQSWEGKIIR